MGWAFALAVALGCWLAAEAMRAPPRRIPLAAAAHGAAGAVGLAWLWVALDGPPRGTASGAAGFGAIAGWLCAAALLSGGAVGWLGHRRGRAPGALLAAHAGAAISAACLLAAWLSLP